MAPPLPVPLLPRMRCESCVRYKDHYSFFLFTLRSCGEETRRRRTELEQRRRDELRDSYRRLKGAVSDQKPDQKPTFSKASLLDCATTYIKCLETRLQEAENETARLRQCVRFSSKRFVMVLTLLIKGQRDFDAGHCRTTPCHCHRQYDRR